MQSVAAACRTAEGTHGAESTQQPSQRNEHRRIRIRSDDGPRIDRVDLTPARLNVVQVTSATLLDFETTIPKAVADLVAAAR
jgi:hypothetical protein